jgi:hypothetical protein
VSQGVISISIFRAGQPLPRSLRERVFTGIGSERKKGYTGLGVTLHLDNSASEAPGVQDDEDNPH